MLAENASEDEPVDEPDKEEDETDAGVEAGSGEEADSSDDTDDSSEEDADGEDPAESSLDSDADDNDAAGTGESGLFAYDFRHPQHRLGDPPAQFRHCGKRVASGIAAALDTELHVESSVELADTRYCKNHEFISDMEADVSVFEVETHPFSMDMLIVVNRGLILALVDRFFGGTTEGGQSELVRQLSTTESRLASRFRTAVVSTLQKVCGDCFSIRDSESAILTSEELASSSHEKAVVAVQEYSVLTNGQEYKFSIVFPWLAVEALLVLSSEEFPDAVVERRKWTAGLTEHVCSCAVEIHGQLSETEVTVAQLLDMQKGDFIPLGEVGATTFRVDNTPVFEASIGASNGFVSASIINWLIEGGARGE